MTPSRLASQPIEVGVFMSVYSGDRADLFERALNSIFNQRLPDSVRINLYLGVDGPIDGALLQVVQAHTGRLHQVVSSPINRGLAATLNALIAARGSEDFYFRMDADDFSLPDRFHLQLERMLEAKVDVLGTAITEVNLDSGERRVVRYFERSENLHRFMCVRVPVAHPTVCLRRRVFDHVASYPDARGNEDVAMWFACAKKGLTFDNLHEPLLEFSISSRFWKRRGLAKAWGEYVAYTQGIYALWGPHWRLAIPAARLLMRLGPQRLSETLYRRRSA